MKLHWWEGTLAGAVIGPMLFGFKELGQSSGAAEREVLGPVMPDLAIGGAVAGTVIGGANGWMYANKYDPHHVWTHVWHRGLTGAVIGAVATPLVFSGGGIGFTAGSVFYSLPAGAALGTAVVEAAKFVSNKFHLASADVQPENGQGSTNPLDASIKAQVAGIDTKLAVRDVHPDEPLSIAANAFNNLKQHLHLA